MQPAYNYANVCGFSLTQCPVFFQLLFWKFGASCGSATRVPGSRLEPSQPPSPGTLELAPAPVRSLTTPAAQVLLPTTPEPAAEAGANALQAARTWRGAASARPVQLCAPASASGTGVGSSVRTRQAQTSTSLVRPRGPQGFVALAAPETAISLVIQYLLMGFPPWLTPNTF